MDTDDSDDEGDDEGGDVLKGSVHLLNFKFFCVYEGVHALRYR